MGIRESGRGFVKEQVDPLRYAGSDQLTPGESTAIALEMIPEGARVLDVGCGTGGVTCLFRDLRGAEVVAVEPHPARADAARGRGLEVHEGELTDGLLRELGTFDVMVFLDVLEHLPDPLAVLEVARTGLRANGSVVASVPNVAHWSVRLNLLKGRFDYQPLGIMDSTHLRWFTRDSLERLFDAAGFSISQWAASAGTWMPDYHSRKPWRWMSPPRRDRVVRRLSRRWPTLFGCQHVVKADLKVDPKA